MKKEYIAKLITGKKDKKNILKYLTKKQKIKGKTYVSSYYSCLEHARVAVGRNLKDGSLNNKKNIGNWPGAFMYIVLIDHIGGMFRIADKAEGKKNFLVALYHFSSLSENNAKILYQLRNSLFHSFSLFDFPRDEKLFLPRVFSVHRGSPIINLPKEDWNGDANIKEENITHVSLFEIGELVEEMHKNIIKSLNENTIKIRIPKDGNFTVKKILNMNTLVA